MIIYYDPKYGVSVPDGQIKDYVDSLIRLINSPNKYDSSLRISVGSELILNQIRVAVKEGLILPNTIPIQFHNRSCIEEAHIDKFGKCSSYPESVLDEQLSYLVG